MMRSKAAGLLLMMVFGGCGATERVSLRVIDRRDGGERPLVGALVRVIPMDMGMVPLPVSGKTLNESAYAKARTAAFTDRDGVVRVDVLGDRGAWIEVERAAVGDGAERAGEAREVWRWVWDSATGELRTDGDERGWTVGLERWRE